MIVAEALLAVCRYSGVRWAVAAALSVALGAVASAALAYPPAAVERWPDEALQATGALINGTHQLQQTALLLWAAVAVGRWGARLWAPGLREGVVAMLLVVAASQAVAAAHALQVGVVGLAGLSPEGKECVAWTVGRAGLAPMAISLTPLVALAVAERLVALWVLRRLLKTGRGAAGGWMSALELKQHCRPLPRRY
ncbi:hypothetical protein [Botrimarina mediterranea]|uniref:hypothetical protein n=1 Tax=Botrimarina mediterranea TaxID=2528022 RepID=UPI00118A63C3|nr:hypothetical protein K2D_26870 [Planctomycetes bacterium K2D]